MSTRLIASLILLALAGFPSIAVADGTILFQSRSGFSTISTTGAQPTTISEGTQTWEPAWSPVGGRIAANCARPETTDSDICTMSEDGSDLIYLTQGPGARYTSPTWSPDGQRIAFLSYPPLGLNSGSSTSILVIPENGSKQLTNGPGRDEDPSWSPDSRHIVFSSNRLGGCSDLFIINVDDGLLRQLTPAESCGVQPAWSPDGAMIAYVAPTTKELVIYLVRPDGTEARPLISGTDPDWAPISYVTSAREISWGVIKVRSQLNLHYP